MAEIVDIYSYLSSHSSGNALKLLLPDESDYISASILKTKQFYESDVLSAMLPFFEQGGLFVDVGANIGNHSVCIAGLTNAEVVSIEPGTKAFSALSASIKVNRFESRITPIQIALGESNREDRLLINKNDLGSSRLASLQVKPSNHEEVEKVTVETLDSVLVRFADKVVTLIKIDTEGSELAILKGASSVISRDRPVLFVENGQLPNCFVYLANLGYSLVDINGLTPVACFVPSEKLSQVPNRGVHHTIFQTERLARDISALRHRVSTDVQKLTATLAFDQSRIAEQCLTHKDELDEIYEKIDTSLTVLADRILDIGGVAHEGASLVWDVYESINEQYSSQSEVADLSDLKIDNLQEEIANILTAKISQLEAAFDDMRNSVVDDISNADVGEVSKLDTQLDDLRYRLFAELKREFELIRKHEQNLSTAFLRHFDRRFAEQEGYYLRSDRQLQRLISRAPTKKWLIKIERSVKETLEKSSVENRGFHEHLKRKISKMSSPLSGVNELLEVANYNNKLLEDIKKEGALARSDINLLSTNEISQTLDLVQSLNKKIDALNEAHQGQVFFIGEQYESFINDRVRIEEKSIDEYGNFFSGLKRFVQRRYSR